MELKRYVETVANEIETILQDKFSLSILLELISLGPHCTKIVTA